MLLTKWFEDPLRPTRDLDFLAVGNNDLEEMVHIFHEVCAVSFNDGVVFDPNSVKMIVSVKKPNMAAYSLQPTLWSTTPKFGS
jgi:hypothetical protein